MPDDLDDKIRAAMKVLDEETPSGYFEAVPNQILARLEDGSMQHGSGTTDFRNKSDALMGPPVVPEDADTNPTPKVEGSDVAPLPKPAAAAAVSTAADRDEDSGLHDIRNLAQSTKQRLSARRITQNPTSRDDDVLASSSGSFANIALPQPAKMVALPDLEDLPSKQEVLAAQKAAAKARKNKPTSEPKLESKDVLAPNATANAALASLTAVPVADTAASTSATDSSAVPVRQAFTLGGRAFEQKKSKAPMMLAVLGIGAAAAAGAFVFLGNKDAKPAAVASAEQPKDVAAAPATAPTAEPIAAAPAEAAPPAPPVEEPKADEAAEAAAAAAVAAAEPDADDAGKAGPKRKRAPAKAAGVKAEVEAKDETKAPETKKEEPKTVKTPDGEKAAKKEGEGEPSFDALLKEAGVEEKKEVKPKLDKKSLSGDDFKKGMGAVNGKAQSCYKGTQGTASVKLTIAPSGQVTKVTVGGQFAGTPEGACVEAAVKAASFPPWDGGPQSFNYSYMLAD